MCSSETTKELTWYFLKYVTEEQKELKTHVPWLNSDSITTPTAFNISFDHIFLETELNLTIRQRLQ